MDLATLFVIMPFSLGLVGICGMVIVIIGLFCIIQKFLPV